MALLIRCPTCRTFQSLKNKKCKCGENIDKAKRSSRVSYYGSYRTPDGKQKRIFFSFSIEEARAFDAKFIVSKKEGRLTDLFDTLKNSKKTFRDLTEWYIQLSSVKNLASYKDVKLNLNSFNNVFGNKQINSIKASDLESYQHMRKKEGLSDSYIDKHIGAARTMLIKAIDNDQISGDVIKPFRVVKKVLKKNSNARDRVLTHDEFQKLMDVLPEHAKFIVATAYYTGMRKGELLNLDWSKVNLEERTIHLSKEDTKDKESRIVPIYEPLMKFFIEARLSEFTNNVFHYHGIPIGEDIRASIKTACEKVGIVYGSKKEKGFVFHDLRHTFVTNMRKAGVTETVIMSITGHSTREMFDRYNKIDREDIFEAGIKLQNKTS